MHVITSHLFIKSINLPKYCKILDSASAPLVGFRPPRSAPIKYTLGKNEPLAGNQYKVCVFVVIYNNNMWNEPSRSARASVIKDSISKWNHFFIELSSCADINYPARTRVPRDPALVFVLRFGMLYKSILFSNYLRRSLENFNVNFAIIQCSDEINSRRESRTTEIGVFIFSNDWETFSRSNYNE